MHFLLMSDSIDGRANVLLDSFMSCAMHIHHKLLLQRKISEPKELVCMDASIYSFIDKQKIVIPSGIGSRPASWTTVLIG